MLEGKRDMRKEEVSKGLQAEYRNPEAAVGRHLPRRILPRLPLCTGPKYLQSLAWVFGRQRASHQ